MDWPQTPTEYLSKFQPPFCPWRECSEHRRVLPGYGFQRHGYFSTGRRWKIPRFRCKTCKRTYSRQTFSVSYYRKRPELLLPIAAGLVAGSALRQIARSVDCAPNTAARMAAHLGRHSMLLHAESLACLRGRVKEPFGFDHFETFEFTQDYPFGIGTSVGVDTWFTYTFDPAPHGRGGTRTPAQARRLRGRPKRPMHGCYEGSTSRAFDLLLPLCARKTLRIRCDAKPDYARAARCHPQAGRIQLERYRSVSRSERQAGSTQAAKRDRAMFPLDLLHKILRHSNANHKRETIAFSRRLNAAMERMALTAVWRNFVKRRSERRRRTSPTPAMEVGLTDEPWSWKRVLSRRLFPDRVELAPIWRRLYRREWITPVLGSNARHALRRAF